MLQRANRNPVELKTRWFRIKRKKADEPCLNIEKYNGHAKEARRPACFIGQLFLLIFSACFLGQQAHTQKFKFALGALIVVEMLAHSHYESIFSSTALRYHMCRFECDVRVCEAELLP